MPWPSRRRAGRSRATTPPPVSTSSCRRRCSRSGYEPARWGSRTPGHGPTIAINAVSSSLGSTRRLPTHGSTASRGCSAASFGKPSRCQHRPSGIAGLSARCPAPRAHLRRFRRQRPATPAPTRRGHRGPPASSDGCQVRMSIKRRSLRFAARRTRPKPSSARRRRRHARPLMLSRSTRSSRMATR